MVHVFTSSEGDASRRGFAVRSGELIKGVVVLLAAIGAIGCGSVSPVDEGAPLGSAYQELIRDGWNGIPPACVGSDFLHRDRTDEAGVTTPGDDQLARLCDQPLAGGCNLKAEWATWLNPDSSDPPDPDDLLRFQLLQAMIQCTLPPERTVLVTASAPVRGMFGAFPEWANMPLTPDRQEFLSACVGAKVNGVGASVQIGIVGPGPGPEPPQPIKNPSFHFQESVIFGTLFGFDPALYVCTGAQDSGGGVVIGLEQRVCTQPGNECNIEGLGPCDPAWCVGGWANPGAPTGAHCLGAQDPLQRSWHYPATVYLRVK